MVKLIGFLIITAFCLIVGLWPEVAMYGIYCAVDPVTELGRIALTLGLLFFGGGLSVVFGILGFAMWVHAIGEVLK